ncbi:hypothetical protein TWF694_009262 [Orbilia ellipsospora]|uniref:SCP domain-containing protein n=1 Tax=Orbilia ellipsospora TaxID=2528407 RepID=A0AAV9XL19_9PEZI
MFIETHAMYLRIDQYILDKFVFLSTTRGIKLGLFEPMQRTCDFAEMWYFDAPATFGDTHPKNTNNKVHMLEEAANLAAAGSPYPTEPDVASNCDNWFQGFSGDNCHSIATAALISEANLLAYNPNLARNCNDIKDQWGYCIHITGSTPIIPTVPQGQTTTFKTTTTPKPQPQTTTPKPQPQTTTQTPPPANTYPPVKPESLPPQNGQKTQCVALTPGKTQPWTVVNDDLQSGVDAACTQIMGGDSKWLEKGNAYTGTTKIFGQVVFYQLKIWLGGFSVPRDTCVQQLRAAVNGCHFDNGATYGGCAYTEDGNLQACFFPSIGLS